MACVSGSWLETENYGSAQPAKSKRVKSRRARQLSDEHREMKRHEAMKHLANKPQRKGPQVRCGRSAASAVFASHLHRLTRFLNVI